MTHESFDVFHSAPTFTAWNHRPSQSMGPKHVKTFGTKSNRSGYKLSQLCRTADFHPSTVHYYMKIGLLHKPRKVGLGVYLYDDSHLKRLKKIRSLRRSENLPLSDIKARLPLDAENDRPSGTAKAGESGPSRSDGLSDVRGSDQAELIRTKILDVATLLFSKKGYDGTRISDITDTLDMAKGSFYLQFKDKRDLFIGCIERLAYIIVPEDRGKISPTKETTQSDRPKGLWHFSRHSLPMRAFSTSSR